jgi:PEP-CTERM motif
MLTLHSYVEFMSAKRKAIAALSALICGTMSVLAAPSGAAIITAGPYTGIGTAGNGTATVFSSPPSFDITSAGKVFTSIGPLDFIFPVTYTDNFSTVTYLVTEGVTNSTTSTWSDYHEQIGNGSDGQFTLGSNPVTFVTPADSTYSNTAFPGRSVSSNEIDYTGGAVAPGQAINLTFSITVPDNGTSPYSFTLRQFPTVVPEPASFGLLALGSIGLLARRKRS